ncbi:unnamed protein product [Ostreobium quekettii]|uniref:C-CAP/cofactor C-like domain-containing protein n=1 Tax=Ostreobium quekettii TaxID=121088 RepID=A0A8S1J575_9CHLO|nr:unnamed protein product [Ostreobium quekettii]
MSTWLLALTSQTSFGGAQDDFMGYNCGGTTNCTGVHWLSDYLSHVAASGHVVFHQTAQDAAVLHFKHECFWKAGEGSPVTHVESTLQSAEFYGNKALKIYRSKDVTHSEWIAAVKDAIKGMKTFVAKYHPAGPQWNAEGVSVQEYLTSGAPPPPPPVQEEKPPAQKPGPTQAWQADKVEKPDELTASLTDAKKGLKKLEGDAEAPAEQKAGVQAAPAVGNAVAAAAAAAAAVALKKVEPAAKEPAATKPATTKPAATKPAAVGKPKEKPAPPPGRTELVADRKWEVEHHKGNHEILIEDNNSKHTLYIFKCEDCVVQVKGKLNAITMDNCSRTGLVFDSVLASVEVVNCKRAEVQCTGHISTLAVDKCDGCQLYVPHTSMDVAVTVAQSSAINIVVTGEQDCEEFPIPEQFVSKFVDGKLVTEPAQHTGSA